MEKLLPCVSLLVSCIMKKSKEKGKLYKLGKKTVYWKPYNMKYIIISCSKFNCLKKIETKIFLSKRNSFALDF